MIINEAATSETAEAPESQVIPTEVQQSSTEPVPEARAVCEGVRPGPTDAPGVAVTAAVAQDSNPLAEGRPELPSDGQGLGTEGITPALEDGAVDPMEAQYKAYKAARLKQAASAAQAPDSAEVPQRKATGPRTEAGKRRSSRNALKHGIYSKAVPVEGESAIEFNALLKGLRKALRPQGMLEHLLVEKLAVLHWCLRRLLGYNYQNILNCKYAGIPAKFVTKHHKSHGWDDETTSRDTLDFSIRYESTLERDIDRTLAQLFRLQEARRG